MSAIVSSTPQDALCVDCDHPFAGAALKCDLRSGCGRFTHLKCSGLPVHYLVRFDVSRASFLCKGCIKTEAGQQFEDCIEKIQRMVNIEADTTSADPSDQDREDHDVVDPTEVNIASSEALISASQQSTVPNSSTRTANLTQTDPMRNQGTTARRSEAPQVCQDFIMKRCQYGASGKVGGTCRHAHPRICRKFLKFGNQANGCNMGQGCTFYHPKLCWEFNKKKTCRRNECRFYHNSLKALPQRRRNLGTRFEPERPTPVTVNDNNRSNHRGQTQSYAAVTAGRDFLRDPQQPSAEAPSAFLEVQTQLQMQMSQLQQLMTTLMTKDITSQQRPTTCHCGQASF